MPLTILVFVFDAMSRPRKCLPLTVFRSIVKLQHETFLIEALMRKEEENCSANKSKPRPAEGHIKGGSKRITHTVNWDM